MTRQIAMASGLALALWCVDGAASTPDDDPVAISPEDVAFLVEHYSYQVTQKAGLGLFGSGLGLSLLGIVFTVIDPYGGLGLAGFITVGGGIVVMSSGMFVLGLSRMSWQRKLREDLAPAVRHAREIGIGLSVYF